MKLVVSDKIDIYQNGSFFLISQGNRNCSYIIRPKSIRIHELLKTRPELR